MSAGVPNRCEHNSKDALPLRSCLAQLSVLGAVCKYLCLCNSCAAHHQLVASMQICARGNELGVTDMNRACAAHQCKVRSICTDRRLHAEQAATRQHANRNHRPAAIIYVNQCITRPTDAS